MIKSPHKPPDDAVSPVVGVILMVAVTVLLSVSVGHIVFGLSIASGDDIQASASVEQTIRNDTGENRVRVTATKIENADYIAVQTSTSIETFRQSVNMAVDQGLHYDTSTSYVGTSGVRWAEKSDDGINRFYISAPSNSGNVSVSYDFTANSYEDSGAAIYAVDVNGNEYVIECDAATDGATDGAPTSLSTPSFTCADNGSNYEWNGTQTVDVGTELDRIYVTTDVENVHGTFKDEARFSRLAVQHTPTDESNSVCVSCRGTLSSSDTSNHDGDDRYYGVNDVDEVGEYILLDGMKTGDTITIIAGKDGEQTVISTYTVD